MVEKLFNISKIKWVQLSFVFVVICIVVGVIYFPNYARLKKLKAENARLTLENKKLEEEIADYAENLKNLGKDPYLYEKIARDSLGIARDNEIVIDIEE